jgi:hypothetical protein
MLNQDLIDLKANDITPQLTARLKKIKLLTPGIANPKTAKSLGQGFLPYILHLAPHKVSGFNVCANASVGCAAACLNTAGRGKFDSIQKSRIRKTLYFVRARALFLSQLVKEIERAKAKADKQNLMLVVRLNGTSDIPWENIQIKQGVNLFQLFPKVFFYDYTKDIKRLSATVPVNYNLTFSASETNDDACQTALKRGFNVAVVFKSVPEYYWKRPVIDGDKHDLRLTDPQGAGYIIGLKAKGPAKNDISGFVR